MSLGYVILLKVVPCPLPSCFTLTVDCHANIEKMRQIYVYGYKDLQEISINEDRKKRKQGRGPLLMGQLFLLILCIATVIHAQSCMVLLYMHR